MKTLAKVFLALTALTATSAWADNQFDFGVGFEQFRWREYDSSGTQLLEEKGPRFVLHGNYENWLPGGAVFGGLADIYFGSVNYDGQTQSGTPVQTDTDYSGIRLEGGGGYLWPASNHGIGIVGSLGLDSWIRTLQDSYTSTGTYVYGYEEDWFTMYARIAGAWNYRNGTWQQRLRAGWKYPFYTENYVPDLGVTLEPKAGPSYFINWDAHWPVSPGFALGLALYYEYTDYHASNAQPSGGFLYYQPESRQWVTGARFQMTF